MPDDRAAGSRLTCTPWSVANPPSPGPRLAVTQVPGEKGADAMVAGMATVW